MFVNTIPLQEFFLARMCLPQKFPREMKWGSPGINGMELDILVDTHVIKPLVLS